MENRRVFLKELATVSALATACSQESAGPAVRSRSIPRDRLAARRRNRRLVWNNDGSDIQSTARGRGTFPAPVRSVDQYLSYTMKYLEGTQVNSIFYNGHTNEPDWEFPTEKIAVLAPNPVKHVVDFARRNGMEFFYSIRMNDTHAAYFPPNRGYWVPFRLQHPELLLGYISQEHWEKKYLPWVMKFIRLEEQRAQQGKTPSNVLPSESELRRQVVAENPLKDVLDRRGLASRDLWSWPAYNYALEGTRAHFLEVVEGICQRYDVDGVELDWIRMPMFFKLGEQRRNIPIMNDFVHQVRRRLDHFAQQKGRPILLAVRVPDSMELCLAVGLDPETWTEQGWVDLLMAGSGLMPFSIPMKEWVELGQRHEVPVYGCLDRIHPLFRTGRPKFDVRDPAITNDDPSNYDAVRAAAHRFWQEGVDGIYLYDWHTHHGPTDPEDFGTVPRLAEPAELAHGNKLYQVDPDFPVRPGQGALADACYPAQIPRALTTVSGVAGVEFTLNVSDAPNSIDQAILLIQWKGDVDQRRVRWTLNGTAVSEASSEHGREWMDLQSGFPPGVERSGRSQESWIGLQLPGNLIRKGPNSLELSVEPAQQGDPSVPVELLQVRLSTSRA